MCHACAARDQRARAWNDAKSDTDGLFWMTTDREEGVPRG